MKVGRRLEIDHLLNMPGVFAAFEINLRKGCQMEGIPGARANRVYAGKGSPALIDAVAMPEMKDEGARSGIAVTNRTYRFSRDSSHSP
jgi:hypothetical protein